MINAAGILFCTPDNRILLLKRADGNDHGREWCCPGGGIEKGESPEQAALREFSEECGMKYDGELSQIFHTNDGNVDFTTFIAHVEEFTPKLNEEHTAFMWCDADDIPNKTHPGVKALLASDAAHDVLNTEFENNTVPEESRADSSEVITEMDIAKRIRDKELTSPQEYKNIMLFSLRITGTGVAYRPKHEEYVQRPPEEYLNDEFLERCNGLPVVWVHPPKDKLDTNSFAEQVIGTICLPYIEGEEVWGIAKVWDMDAAAEMAKNQLSTSPSVIFDEGTNTKIVLSSGEQVLQEGKPSLVDHLAVVENGVWDKCGKPSGVLLETAHAETAEASRADSAGQCDSLVKEETMADAENTQVETSAAPSAESEMLTLLKGIGAKLEGLEGRLVALEGMEKKEEVELAKPDSVAPMMKPEPETAADNNAAGATAATIPDPAIVADRARLDSVEKELEKMRADAARSEDQAERTKLLEAQAKADAVEQCYGDSARAPLRGETVREYELATVKKHQARSKRWSGVDVASIKDDSAFAIIRDEVYADSVKAAHSCVGMAEDVIVPIKTVDGGCTTTVFRGKKSFVAGMSQKPM